MLTSGILRSVEWQFLTDLSGQPNDLIVNVQEIQQEEFSLDFFMLQDETDRLSRIVGKE